MTAACDRPPRPNGKADSGAPKSERPAKPASPISKSPERKKTFLGVGAVNRGLAWLAGNQEPDGRWSSARHEGEQGYDGLATGLAVLAFSAQGQSERHGTHRKTVAKATEWIRGVQREDGFFDCGKERPYLQHLICAVALSEAYGMSSRPPEDRGPVQQALDYTTRSLGNGPPKWGWGYGPGDEPDTLATCLAVMQMKCATVAGLQADESAIAGGYAWFDSVTDPKTGGVAFRPGGGTTPAMTAAALLARLFQRYYRREAMAQMSADICVANLPSWDDGSRDFGYWYFGTLAIFQMHRLKPWHRWRATLWDMLRSKMRADGDFAGSWDPGDGWSAGGGRVASTALAVNCLSIYHHTYIGWD